MAELTDQQRNLIRAHRTEVDVLRNDYGRWVHVANATEAVLQLAGGAPVAEVAPRMGQPEWRVAFWGARVAELGAAGVEVGYLPPGALDIEPRSLKVGIGLDCRLTTAAVADWARSSWISEGLGIDLADDAVYLVWPESMKLSVLTPASGASTSCASTTGRSGGRPRGISRCVVGRLPGQHVRPRHGQPGD